MPLIPGQAVPNDDEAPISVGNAAGAQRSLNSTLRSSDYLVTRATDQPNSSIDQIQSLFGTYGEAANLDDSPVYRFGEFRGAQIIKAVVTATPETPSRYGDTNNGIITVTISQTSFSQMAGLRQARITIGAVQQTINPDVTTTADLATLNAGTYTVVVKDNKTGAEESVSIEVTYGGTARSATIIGTQRV